MRSLVGSKAAVIVCTAVCVAAGLVAEAAQWRENEPITIPAGSALLDQVTLNLTASC